MVCERSNRKFDTSVFSENINTKKDHGGVLPCLASVVAILPGSLPNVGLFSMDHHDTVISRHPFLTRFSPTYGGREKIKRTRDFVEQSATKYPLDQAGRGSNTIQRTQNTTM